MNTGISDRLPDNEAFNVKCDFEFEQKSHFKALDKFIKLPYSIFTETAHNDD